MRIGGKVGDNIKSLPIDNNSNTLQLIMISSWENNKGWTMNNKPVNSKIISIIPDSSGEYWSSKVKKYVEENRDYINRYSKRIQNGI